ncbi:MAG: hypothetical protein KDA69_00290 [Planctomycetaceae bacterium]|nr:hypothetical protein [Planctomycetaceae bacterium]
MHSWSKNFFACCFVLVAASHWPQQASAETPYDNDPIWKVEIDWEIRVVNPSAETSSPQISLIISAFPHLDSWYGEIIVNSCQYSSGAYDGGISTRLWNGLSPSTSTYSRVDQPIVLDDVIELTQMFSIEESTSTPGTTVLWSKHKASSSSTWGSVLQFGGGMGNSPLANLNNFDLQVTYNESGVNVGRNRVERIRVNKVRLYHASGEITETSPSYEIHNGLIGDTASFRTLNSDGTYSTVPVDSKTSDSVEFNTGF